MGRSGDKKKEYILRITMSCIADLGLEKTTFQAIADRAGISQPLVVYHLKTRENIFAEVFQYLLDASLAVTEAAISKPETATERLEAYIETSMHFFRSAPAIAPVYVAFYYLSSFHPQYKMMNDKLKAEATQRILNIIAQGLGSGEFKTSNPALVAKLIHTSITGLLLNLATERSMFSDDQLLAELKVGCLAMTGAHLRKKKSDSH